MGCGRLDICPRHPLSECQWDYDIQDWRCPTCEGLHLRWTWYGRLWLRLTRRRPEEI